MQIREGEWRQRTTRFPFAIKDYCKTIGEPEAIICDPACKQIMGEAKKVCDQAGYSIQPLENET